MPGERNQWYTSGYTVDDTQPDNPTFKWLDDQGFGSNVFWTDPLSPKTDNGKYVVYKYADTGNHQEQPGYFWVRDAGLIPRAFICEINKADSEVINSVSRNFGKLHYIVQNKVRFCYEALWFSKLIMDLRCHIK